MSQETSRSQKRGQKNATTGYVTEQGMRFAATCTCLTLLLLLVTAGAFGIHTWATALVAGFVWASFAIGAFISPQHTLFAFVYKTWVRQRIKNPTLEHVAAPRFAQLVGFVFLTVTMIGVVTNIPPFFLVGTIGALAGAFINAAFNYCIACRLYRVFRHSQRIPVLVANENV